MTDKDIVLTVLDEAFDVCRFPVGAPPSFSVLQGNRFKSFTVTDEEISIVCAAGTFNLVDNIRVEADWKAFKVKGPLDFSLTGVLYGLAKPLAEEGISIFVISTFDTDYLFVKSVQFDKAKTTLMKHFTIE